MSTWRLLLGDCRETLRTLPADSVQCVVTSPPYWGLRDYGHPDQLGLEPTPALYVEHMVEVFREVRRVLRPDGVLWLNLGDSYAASGSPPPQGRESLPPSHVGVKHDLFTGQRGGQKPVPGLKPKDLVGIPWRVAFALQADGWWLRSDIIWHKPNPMPESVTDRPTKAHEYLFLMAKGERYYYDSEAIAEPSVIGEGAVRNITPRNKGQASTRNDGDRFGIVNDGTRNARSVWTIPTTPYPGAHFATFPPELAEKCILAGTSQRGACPKCGAPWERVVERETLRERADAAGTWADRPKATQFGRSSGLSQSNSHNDSTPTAGTARTVDWRSMCDCDAGDPVPCTVLDPFGGSGTVGMVATGHGRHAILCELNPKYADLIRDRCGPMLESAA